MQAHLVRGLGGRVGGQACSPTHCFPAVQMLQEEFRPSGILPMKGAMRPLKSRNTWLMPPGGAQVRCHYGMRAEEPFLVWDLNIVPYDETAGPSGRDTLNPHPE